MKSLQLVATAHKGEFNAIYRTCIAYTGEIHEIMWRGVFYVYKPYFFMPGHNL